MRLIEADRLSDEVQKSKENNPHFDGRVRRTHNHEHNHFLRMIDDAPTIDAVPVVRCRDCKHYEESTGWCMKHSHFVDSNGFFCYPDESPEWKMFKEDDFCSYGERKAENPCDHCMSGSYRGCDGCGYGERKGGEGDG